MNKLINITAAGALALCAACNIKPAADQPTVADDVAVEVADSVITEEKVPEVKAEPEAEPVLHYTNARFGFSIDVPCEFVEGQESENGDGKTFIIENEGAITVSAALNAMNYSPVEFYKHLDQPSDTYKNHKGDWAVWSGYNPDGSIYYTKAVLKNGTLYYLQLNYQQEQREKFQTITSFVLEHWKTGLAKCKS